MKEIVGARIGFSIITTDPGTIQGNLDSVTLWIDRELSQRMAGFGIGAHWKDMARSRTLFFVDDSGKLYAPAKVEASNNGGVKVTITHE